MMMEGLCYDCRNKEGYKRKDQGAHTAILKDCAGCGEKKVILPSRHWVIRLAKPAMIDDT
jgi:hypothetical protein